MRQLDIRTVTDIRDMLDGIDEAISHNLSRVTGPDNGGSNVYDSDFKDQIHATFDVKPAKFGSLLRSDHPFRGSVIETEPNLICEMEDGLSQIEFKRGDTTLSLSDPSLIWDCHCELPNGPVPPPFTPQESAHNCPFHDTEAGRYMLNSPDDGVLEYRYDNVRVFYYASEHLYPLSVDAIVMYDNLKSSGILDKPLETMVDVGCGIGFVPIALAVNSPTIEHLALIDLVVNPLLVSKWNCILNQKPGTRFSHEQYLNVGLDKMPTLGEGASPFPTDLLVSNPPYLPSTTTSEFKTDVRVMDDLRLLEELIKKGPDIATEMYLNVSSLAEPDIRRLGDTHGRTITQIGKSVTVPFTVTPALKDQAYINDLRKRGLYETEGKRYHFWHDIRTFRIGN